MNYYFKGIASLAATLCVCGSIAAAAPMTCNLSSWKGANNKATAVYWAGIGFVVDEAKGAVQILDEGNKRSNWLPVTAKKTKKFTTYGYDMPLKRRSGHSAVQAASVMEFSFRVYTSGKCQTSVSAGPRFHPMIATGEMAQ